MAVPPANEFPARWTLMVLIGTSYRPLWYHVVPSVKGVDGEAGRTRQAERNGRRPSQADPGGGVRDREGARVRASDHARDRDPGQGLEARALRAVRRQAGDHRIVHRRARAPDAETPGAAGGPRPRRSGAALVRLRREGAA